MSSLRSELDVRRLIRRAAKHLWRSSAARLALIEVMQSANPAVVLLPDQRLVERGHPSNPGGPRVINYLPGPPSPVVIGKYSSINDNSYVMPGSNHRIDFVSSYVFWDTEVPERDQAFSKGPISIGSDVVTGFESLILSGVSVGDGAVIGARAVVTRDVPPYAIVAGVPARIVGWRFDEVTREKLLRIRWWEWPEEKVLSHVRQLVSPDVEGFVRLHDPGGASGICPQCSMSP